MEEYYQETNYETEKYQNLHSVNTTKAIIIFLIGLIGLSLIFTVIWNLILLIFSNQINEENIYKFDSYGQVSAYLIGTIIVFSIIGVKNIKKLFYKFKDLNVYIKGIIFGFILLFAQTVYGVFSTIAFGEVESNVNQQSIILLVKSSPIPLFIMTVILAPIFEEIVYRYALFGALHKKNRWFAYIVCFTIFGLIHFDFSCFNNNDFEAIKVELVNLPSYILSGGILCYAYEKEDSIISSMIAHATNNLVAFLQIIFLVTNS